MTTMKSAVAETDIAVVGMAGRFPGARDLAEYWNNLRDGVESLTQLTDEQLEASGVDPALIRDPEYVKAAFVVPEMEMFDGSFFGFSPRDASIMDPQQRHFIECCWSALEHAGHVPANFDGSIGVYAGCGASMYMINNLLTNPQLVHQVGFFLLRHTGNDKDFLATRVSYLMNLTGPSVNVQTACSTSLVAIHQAVQSLLNGECDMAIAGGSTFRQPHAAGYVYKEGEIVSPDGHCRSFDESSQGTVFGSGVGVVVLRRALDAIADGDTIHALIKASAINNDGSMKVGYLAPSVDGQAKAVAEALAMSGVHPETINYVEAHGTGTPVGDPIEITALTQAFRAKTSKTGYCAIGSVKSNIGHLDTAAGVAGFIKTVLALKHRHIPPSLFFERPNPGCEFETSPFFVNTTLREWTPNGAPRRAGVSALGAGGTNAHVILEEAPDMGASDEPARAQQLIVLSAKTPTALDAATANLARFLRDSTPPLADVAYTSQLGRQAFAHRRAISAADVAEAIELLESNDPKRVATQQAGGEAPSVAFMFAGGGAQHATMGADLYAAEPVYRTEIDRCFAFMKSKHGIDLGPLVFARSDDAERATRELERPSLALPALFSTQYALAKLLMSWGVSPQAMIGHSMGEYTAACLAGVFSVEDGLSLVTTRGRLFEQLAAGGMLSVPLSAEELRPMLPAELSIAAVNAPELCVASGPVSAVETLERALTAQEIDCRRIHINVAAHSAMLEPILEEFGAFVRGIALRAPQMPFVSNVTGTWITEADATDASYWVKHLRQTVRFAEGVGELLADPRRVLLEVGPGRTLTTLARQHSAKQSTHGIYASMRHPDEQTSDVAFALGAIGRLWTHGVDVEWRALHGADQRRRIPMPTYPFERKRHWIAPGKGVVTTVAEEGPPRKRPDLAEWLYQPSWRRTTPSAIVAAPAAEPVLVFVDESGLGEQIADSMRSLGRDVWTVTAGNGFARTSERAFTIAAAEREDYERLFRELVADGIAPGDIVHCFTVTAPNAVHAAEQIRDFSFYSLLHLAQAIIGEDLAHPIRLSVISSDMQHVAGETALTPEKAQLLGPCKVIPREVPNVRARSIDIVRPQSGARREKHLVQQLVGEICSPVTDEVIAFRGADRWVQTFEPMAVDPDTRPNRVREGGVYLITGGLGGIGLTVAEHLARTAKPRLVLVARTKMPEREEWDAWIARRGENDRVSRAIARVRSLEELGAEVMVARGDVTDRSRMVEIVREAVARFGTINGVIHGAGALDDGLIATKDRATADRVLAPKVEGTLSLDAAVRGLDLDFFVVFSSRGAIAGPAGQVDYVAANAFLDAFAHRKTALEETPAIAINWSMWRDVGMAASIGAHGDVDEPVEHPLLDRRVRRTAKEDVFSTVFSIADHWLLDGHRIRGGEALIPGTGYLELAYAALREGGNSGDVELRDVFFISPFVVRADERRELRVKVTRNAGESEIVIIGEGFTADGGREWHEHARAVAVSANGVAPAPVDLDAVIARCNLREQTFTGTEEREHLVLGKRWSNIHRINYGHDEAIATLELPAQFSDDLTRFALHPAMLDVATACAQQLIHGFDPHADFYVPASYTRLRARGAIPQRCFSHIRYLPSEDKDIAAFDVTILDETGQVVVEIEEFVMMRVSDKGRMGGDPAEDRKPVIHAEGQVEDAAPVMSLEEAITPAEGVEVFRRALSEAMPAQIVVSPSDLQRYLHHMRAPRLAAGVECPESTANLAEIEAVLTTHEAVRQGIVLSHGERAGTQQLAAYVVYDENAHATVSELRRFLRERLPEDMVPQHFVELDELPLASNGKIDRASLPNPFGDGDDYVAPRTPMERIVATIWQELLGVARVSVHDNFLDAGGHSLLAMRVITRIAKQTGVRVNQSALNLLTLEQLAAECEQKAGVQSPASSPAPTSATTPEPVQAPQGFRQRFLSAFKSASRG